MPKEEKEDLACSAKKSLILSCFKFMVSVRFLSSSGARFEVRRCEVFQTKVTMYFELETRLHGSIQTQ